MSAVASDSAAEFDCCECGRHIVRFDRVLPDPRLCGLCLMAPGWMDYPPEIRALLDPDWREEDRP